MSRTAIVVFSDPVSGGDEALGRVFNALFLTLELVEKDQDVALIFQGAGTRWPDRLSQPDHPANALYNRVQPAVAGVCGACADVFGATKNVAATGLPLVRERHIAGVGEVIDLSRYLDQGYRLVTF
jgi:sulfur relay (sulfurtransferase) complex TusBCD TusD component (DsrE family)